MTKDNNQLDAQEITRKDWSSEQEGNDFVDSISDTELEVTASHEVATNIESGLESGSQKKNDLIQELKESNEAMKSEINKLTKIAATSQAQYISLKGEFDSYIKRIDAEKKEIKLSELKKIVTKFSKLLEQIRLFLSHLNTDLVDNEQIKWLQLIYESFINQELSQMGIFQIQSLWLIPDIDLHEVLLIQPATSQDLDKLLEYNVKLDWEKEEYELADLSGHIISEFEVGYYYFDGEKKIIIKPSKVAVGE